MPWVMKPDLRVSTANKKRISINVINLQTLNKKNVISDLSTHLAAPARR